jgi:hypothetical protein
MLLILGQQMSISTKADVHLLWLEWLMAGYRLHRLSCEAKIARVGIIQGYLGEFETRNCISND